MLKKSPDSKIGMKTDKIKEKERGRKNIQPAGKKRKKRG